MKKKLLMAAVGAALVAGPMVAAHAAGATLYGHFHMSMDRIDNDVNEEGFMANNSSRFGIKGDEDLGGGLKAIYQVESPIFAADEGTGGFGGTLRNTFMGFAGSWGTVKLGRHDTAYKDLGRKLDNFNEQVGDMRNFIGNAGAYDARVSNMIRYESPNFSGFNAVVQNTSNAGSDAAGNTSNKDTSVGLNFSSGPLFVGAAWNEVGNTGSDNDTTGIRLAGAYTMDAFTIGLLWESLSDMGGVSGADRDAMGLVAAMTMGNNKFKFHWLNADKVDNSATDNGGDMWAIGVDHVFSKTAMVYLNYASVSNDTAGTFTTSSANGGHGDNLTTAAGNDATGISAGYILKF
ncbi:porin [Sulfuricaulis limicola]|uniref:Porin n=1 Tax=Sulfuricaulis limicola TaxID=1620215 RepID=A0A1B4XIK5_9GAMM|nr:porin [Sulfuricaulis limicola]BAV34627.1 porin [Sulfuricaulis limicola]